MCIPGYTCVYLDIPAYMCIPGYTCVYLDIPAYMCIFTELDKQIDREMKGVRGGMWVGSVRGGVSRMGVQSKKLYCPV